MDFFLPQRLTLGKAPSPRKPRWTVERRFIGIRSHESVERSERFRSFLIHGAVILASATNGDTSAKD